MRTVILGFAALSLLIAGSFTREVQDDGQTAVIHIAGKSLETALGPGGVPIDLTVSCPTVNRG